jgi:poly(3-hydroxybutyrate) depolymerase
MRDSTNVVQNTQLDRQQLSYCVSLIENGANPEALAVRPPTLPSSSSAVVPYHGFGSCATAR